MSAADLKRLIDDALTEAGVAKLERARLPKGKARSTTWIAIEHGLGIRHYPSGRNVYIVQTRMAGRLRTVTIGPASIITQHQATLVARRVIAHAQVGLDPAAVRQRVRAVPRFDDFLEEYWQRWSPRWKPSTLRTQNAYRRTYLDPAFAGLFVDAISEADVVKWFADVNERTGPGGANRAMSILSSMFVKAEDWGYRLENTNPCRGVKLNRKRASQRFLSHEEMARLGGVLDRLRAGDDKVRSTAATAISLLLLTGCRVSEVLSLQWEQVRGHRLFLHDSKTGPRTVWLGDEARRLIDGLPRYPVPRIESRRPARLSRTRPRPRAKEQNDQLSAWGRKLPLKLGPDA